MMVFFDTNVLIYALCNNIDDAEQQNISVKLFEEAVLNKSIILSELILCEFAFTSKKLKENENIIEQNLKYLSQYAKANNKNTSTRIVDIIEKTKLFASSFDIFHLAFCEENNCKLITFDKGFKKLQNISKIEIDIK
ncbi:MAG: PIN domain-containing protein [Campylobacterota bacterium]|nr:PIN domain-containing protein [Campylobacterota bacterium]